MNWSPNHLLRLYVAALAVAAVALGRLVARRVDPLEVAVRALELADALRLPVVGRVVARQLLSNN